MTTNSLDDEPDSTMSLIGAAQRAFNRFSVRRVRFHDASRAHSWWYRSDRSGHGPTPACRWLAGRDDESEVRVLLMVLSGAAMGATRRGCRPGGAVEQLAELGAGTWSDPEIVSTSMS